MRLKLAALPALMLAAVALAGCDKPKERMLQGWVEAETVFVSPDEQGRVEVLKVRQGDKVEKGDLLFTLDDDLQKADVVVKQAAVSDRAAEFRSRRRIVEVEVRHAKSARRRLGRICARPKPIWHGRRRGWRAARALSPAAGSIQEVYFRPGETVPPGRPVIGLLPPSNLKIRFFVAGDRSRHHQDRRDRDSQLRCLRRRVDRQSEFHRAQRRIYAAGDLLAWRSAPSWCS